MNDYLDVHSILSEDAVIPTTLTWGVCDVGKIIDPSASDIDLAPSTQVCLPLWLSTALVHSELAEAELPPIYCERNRRKMEAGAECVNLRNKAPYFYTVGIKFNELHPDTDLLDYMVDAFRHRYQRLLLCAYTTYSMERLLQLRNKLSQEELQLFEGGSEAVQALEEWRGNTNSSISTMLRSRRKRKGHDLDKENIDPQGKK